MLLKGPTKLLRPTAKHSQLIDLLTCRLILASGGILPGDSSSAWITSSATHPGHCKERRYSLHFLQCLISCSSSALGGSYVGITSHRNRKISGSNKDGLVVSTKTLRNFKCFVCYAIRVKSQIVMLSHNDEIKQNSRRTKVYQRMYKYFCLYIYFHTTLQK